MQISEKINFKKYIILNLILLFLCNFILRDINELIAVIVVLVASILNQWMLVTSIQEMTRAAATGVQVKKLGLVLMLLGKLVLVVGALSFGVQIMGKRVIIPLFIYILQIAVLYFSLKDTPAKNDGNQVQ